MIEKETIIPGIVLYKNALPNFLNVLDTVIESESGQDDQALIKPWRDWNNGIGIMSSGVSSDYEYRKQDEKYLQQHEVIRSIWDSFDAVLNDYVSEYDDVNFFPHYVNTLDFKNKSWVNAQIDFLKYFKDSKNDKYALSCHNDQATWLDESRGPKFVLTVTMYLNDNYGGGDLCFFNENDTNAVLYKPSAGDIIVFPSFYPYFHGVHSIESGNKYLIRMFKFWDYVGSEEWLENEKLYGKEKWAELEKKRSQKEFNSGKSDRNVCLKGEEQEEGVVGIPPFYVDSISRHRL